MELSCELANMECVDPDLMKEVDSRYECIRRTLTKSELQKLLKVFDQLQVGSSGPVPPPSLQQKLQKESCTPSRNGFCYLYVQRRERLSRLNISKLSECPKFELVCDIGSSHPRAMRSPVVCFNVESEIYMVGDVLQKYRPKRYKPSDRNITGEPFLDVLSIGTGKSPSFVPCPPFPGTIAAGFTGPKAKPLVVTLHGRIYVLALCPYVDLPSFEVFDNGKWETLHRPPMYKCQRDNNYSLQTQTFFLAHYAWGHRIVVCLDEDIKYRFDTKTSKWKKMDLPVLQCVVEYHNFLIAKPYFTEGIVVYELDANGYPHFYQNLDSLQEIFVGSGVGATTNAFIIPFDGDADKFCFICSGRGPCLDFDRPIGYFVRVAVFRMTISNLDGKEKLTAVLEAHQIYPFYSLLSHFYPQICSAFLMCDNLNLDNLDVDGSFGGPCLEVADAVDDVPFSVSSPCWSASDHKRDDTDGIKAVAATPSR